MSISAFLILPECPKCLHDSDWLCSVTVCSHSNNSGQLSPVGVYSLTDGLPGDCTRDGSQLLAPHSQYKDHTARARRSHVCTAASSLQLGHGVLMVCIGGDAALVGLCKGWHCTEAETEMIPPRGAYRLSNSLTERRDAQRYLPQVISGWLRGRAQCPLPVLSVILFWEQLS